MIHHIFLFRVWKFYIGTTVSVVIFRAAAGATQFQFERYSIWLLLLLLLLLLVVLLLLLLWRHVYALAFSFRLHRRLEVKVMGSSVWIVGRLRFQQEKLNFLNSIELWLVPQVLVIQNKSIIIADKSKYLTSFPSALKRLKVFALLQRPRTKLNWLFRNFITSHWVSLINMLRFLTP